MNLRKQCEKIGYKGETTTCFNKKAKFNLGVGFEIESKSCVRADCKELK